MPSRRVRSHTRVIAASIICAVLFACTSGTGPQTLTDRLTGTWSENGLGQFGSVFTMVLAAHDTTVTGRGNYSIEAGRSGTVTVAGVIHGQNIDLTITYDYGDVAHFSGTLPSAGELDGSWRTTSDPIEVSFTKVAQ